jgi:hypothetical protein
MIQELLLGSFPSSPHLMWLPRDIWNEPDNSGYTAELIAPLIEQVFSWCREANPTQPLTTPLWKDRPWNGKFNSFQKIQIESSDIISFHNYGDLNDLQAAVESLQGYGKPIICTEYMARGAGSYFNPNMGYLKEAGVAAFNWGLVSGLTQTIYPWYHLCLLLLFPYFLFISTVPQG